MAVPKPGTPISQFVDMIGTTFDGYIYVFELILSNGILKSAVRPNKCEIHMAASTMEVPISQLVDMIRTRFQRYVYVFKASFPLDSAESGKFKTGSNLISAFR